MATAQISSRKLSISSNIINTVTRSEDFFVAGKTQPLVGMQRKPENRTGLDPLLKINNLKKDDLIPSHPVFKMSSSGRGNQPDSPEMVHHEAEQSVRERSYSEPTNPFDGEAFIGSAGFDKGLSMENRCCRSHRRIKSSPTPSTSYDFLNTTQKIQTKSSSGIEPKKKAT